MLFSVVKIVHIGWMLCCIITYILLIVFFFLFFCVENGIALVAFGLEGMISNECKPLNHLVM